jgi:hypothetical protein
MWLVPPSRWYTYPDVWTVSTRHAMLNSVRYGGFPERELTVDWISALDAATIIAA